MSTLAAPDTPSVSRLRSIIYVLLVITVVGITFSIAVSSIAMGTAIGLWLVILVMTRFRGFDRTPLDYFFLAYAAAEILATIFSVSPADSLVNMKRLLLIAVMYLALTSVDSERKIKIVLVLLAVVTTLLTLFELFSLTKIGEHFVRIALFQYYITEAEIKMIVMLMLVPVIIHAGTPRYWRTGAIVSEIVLLLGIIVTQTRSSWLGLIAGVCALAFVRSKKLLIAVVAVVGLFVLFAPSDFKNRASSMFDPNMTSNLTRIHMIQTGWRMFQDYPIVGTGDIDLKKLYITYITPIDEGEGGHLHNNMMMLLVTLGAVGFIATMAVFVKIFTVELDLIKNTENHWLFESVALGAFACYIAFHVNGLFEWNFGDHEIAVFLWFTIGLAMAAHRLSKATAR
ncbi:MAG TPA: O-antigen ligase family protein [Bacteroidota bacterium]|nr:O-antigen ligase family protein [Bacteroidota bacterium]